MSTLVQRMFWLLYLILTWLNHKRLGIRDFLSNLPENGDMELDVFLADSNNKRAMNDWIYKYTTHQKAETAFKRKLSIIYKKMPKKHQRKLTGDVNWERILADAKTQQTFLVNSSKVLRSSGIYVSRELIESMNVSNTN